MQSGPVIREGRPLTVMNVRAITGFALRALAQANSNIAEATLRLSSGMRINSASDDPAGLSLATVQRTRARLFSQSTRNINDGVSVLNVADAALSAQTQIVSRLAELANQSASSTFTDAQRESLQTEYAALVSEFGRVGATAELYDRNLIAGNTTTSSSSLSLLAGADSSPANQITVTVASAVPTTNVWEALRPYIGNVTQTAEEAVSSITDFLTSSGPGIYTWTDAQVQAFVGAGTASVVVPGEHLGSNRDVLVVAMARVSAWSVRTMEFERDLVDPSKWTTLINSTDALRIINASNAGVGNIVYDGSDNLVYESLTGSTLEMGTKVSGTPSVKGAFYNLFASSVATASKAQSAITTLQSAQNALTTMRGNVVGYLSRFSVMLGSLERESDNANSAASQILDIDMATEVAALLKNQIRSQQATAVLASASQSLGTVEMLLGA
jgi:flagellin